MEGTVHPMVSLVLLTAETVRLSGVTGLLGPVEERRDDYLNNNFSILTYPQLSLQCQCSSFQYLCLLQD